MASPSWPGDLPVELMEDVLLRVPWHDLGRSRVVSKAWNHMVMQLPRFVPIPRPETCIFTAIRVEIRTSRVIPTPKATDLHPWQLLDVATTRRHSIDDGFIRVVRGSRGRYFLRRAIATSGGLIYAVFETTNRRHIPRHVVCNPVCRIFHPIQAPPGGEHSIAAMVMEAATQRYRIVQIRGTSTDHAAPGQVYLYDSRVRLWRTLCDAPAGVARCPTSCVVLDGILYALFLDQSNRLNELFSCDLERGNQWRLIDADLPRPPRQHQNLIISHYQVVTAAGRLFKVEYSGQAKEEAVLVTIWEIDLGSSRRLTLLDYLPRNWNFPGFSDAYPITFPAVAVGCGDWIIVSTFVGRRVKWDVVRGTWHRMSPFMPVIDFDGFARHSVFVGPILHLNMRTMPPQ